MGSTWGVFESLPTKSDMASNSSFRSLINKSRLINPKTLQSINPIKPQQTRSFFGGRNWDPFSDLNTAMKEMERNSRELENAFRRMRFPGIPSTNIPVQGVQGGVHRINLDLTGFKPEGVNVSLNNNILKINASMDQTSECGTQRIQQSVTREYTLPENLELGKMKSLLSEDGILSIETPVKGGPNEPKGPQEIPISRDSNPK